MRRKQRGRALRRDSESAFIFPMSYFHEKSILGFAGLLSWSVTTLGAVMVEDEALRYFYATFSISILTAFFMALVLRYAV